MSTEGTEAAWYDPQKDTLRSAKDRSINAENYEAKYKKRGTFVKFTRETTLHGFKYLDPTHTGLLRKLIWLALLVAASAVLIYQVMQQYKFFQQNPITTKIDMEYYSKMHFPAVAICNTNKFRISYTSDNIFPVINDVYSNGSRQNLTENQKSMFQKLPDNETDSVAFLSKAAHMIENLLISCTFPNKTKCYASDFEPVKTDYGICYAINTDKYNPVMVSSAGADSGLTLVLNMESYEHIERPLQTLGMMVLIYNQTSFPMVSLVGIDVPPGYLSKIPISMQTRERILYSKGGSCVPQQPLEHFNTSDYSVSTCKFDKMLSKIENACGCTPYNAPIVPKGKQRCTAQEHFECVINLTEMPKDAVNCKENCTSVDFKKTVSISLLQQYAIEYELTPKVLSQMMKQFKKAKEARVRHHPIEQKRDGEIFNEINAMDLKMKQLNISPYVRNYTSVFDKMKDKATCFDSLVNKTTKLGFFHTTMIEEALNWQAYNDRNIPWERLILLMYPEITENELLQNKTMEDELAQSLTWLVDDLLTAKQNLAYVSKIYDYITYHAEQAQTNELYSSYMELIKSFHRGNITKFQFGEMSNEIRTRINANLETDLFDPLKLNLKSGLWQFLTWKKIAEAIKFLNGTFLINATMTQILFEDLFYQQETKFATAKHKNETCIELMKELQESNKKTDSKQASGPSGSSMSGSGPAQGLSGSSVPGSLDPSTVGPAPEASDPSATGPTRLGVTSGLSGRETGAETSDGNIPEPDGGPSNPPGGPKSSPKPKRKKRAANNPTTVEDTDETYLEMCPTVAEFDLPAYLNELIDCTTSIIPPIVEMLTTELEEGEELIYSALKNLDDDLDDYLLEFEWDQNFYTQNTLAVNIYYQDLGNERLIQVNSYDIWSLACDVGGTLGLFLGASALTAFEIFDFFILIPLLEWKSRKGKVKENDNKRRPRPQKGPTFGLY